MSYLVAGVGTVQLFDPSTHALILTSKTLTNEGLNFGSSAEEARGGMGNALLGKYYHDTSFGLTLTDQLFDLQYLSLNCGGSITAASDIMTNEQVTVSTAGQITVSQTPVNFMGGTYGWYKKPSESDDKYKLVTFSGKNASIDTALVGDVYCVKYFYKNNSARQFVVNTAYVPSIVYAVATFPLFKAGTSTEQYTSSSQIGEIQVTIPNFQLEGAQELSLTSGGIATSSLNGSALATFSGNSGCSDKGYYAIISEVIYAKNAFDNVVSIAIADSDVILAENETQKLVVLAIYSDGTAPTVLDNGLFTFTSTDDTKVSVDNDGVVTGVAQGNATISVVATGYTALSAYAIATVTA
jgi:hypothetical protein